MSLLSLLFAAGTVATPASAQQTFAEAAKGAVFGICEAGRETGPAYDKLQEWSQYLELTESPRSIGRAFADGGIISVTFAEDFRCVVVLTGPHSTVARQAIFDELADEQGYAVTREVVVNATRFERLYARKCGPDQCNVVARLQDGEKPSSIFEFSVTE